MVLFLKASAHVGFLKKSLEKWYYMGEIALQKKEAIILGCLFVANRMLKKQICKFVREKSLVFIFISQSGFLLAEQQARKRPILTT